jgi:hypothetical protein
MVDDFYDRVPAMESMEMRIVTTGPWLGSYGVLIAFF